MSSIYGTPRLAFNSSIIDDAYNLAKKLNEICRDTLTQSECNAKFSASSLDDDGYCIFFGLEGESIWLCGYHTVKLDELIEFANKNKKQEAALKVLFADLMQKHPELQALKWTDEPEYLLSCTT